MPQVTAGLVTGESREQNAAAASAMSERWYRLEAVFDSGMQDVEPRRSSIFQMAMCGDKNEKISSRWFFLVQMLYSECISDTMESASTFSFPATSLVQDRSASCLKKRWDLLTGSGRLSK
jgi:hypothetical protein